MGLLDKLKIRRSGDKKKTATQEKVKVDKKSASAKASADKEEKQETVVTPDGRLINVQKKGEAKTKKAKTKKEDTGEAYRVLIKPLITEKGSSLGIFNKYIFEVATHTGKIEIKKAIKKVYGVDPIKVNIINILGKKVRYGRTEGRTKHWKKAVVTLPQGQKIDVQEGL